MIAGSLAWKYQRQIQGQITQIQNLQVNLPVVVIFYLTGSTIVPIEQSVSHRSRLKLVGFPIDLVRHFAAYSQKKYPEKFPLLWP